MNNQQLYLAIGIPSFIAIFNMGVVVTLLLHFVNKLDSRLDKLDSCLDKVDARLDLIQKDQREFYATQRVHDARLDALERKSNPS